MASASTTSTKVPLVSVIMPCKNTQAYLGRAMSSVLAQTLRDLELLYVDDGSTDGSLDIATRFAASDDRVRILRTENSSGTAAARNLAIENARGRYIAFLDSDDWWSPQKLERQLRFADEVNGAITHTSYWTVDEQDNILSTRRARIRADYRDLLFTNHIGCLTGMIDTLRLGKRYFPLTPLNEDFLFWMQILAEGHRAYGLNEPLAGYRISRHSKSSRKIAVALDRWAKYRGDLKLGIASSAFYWVCYCYFGIRKTP